MREAGFAAAARLLDGDLIKQGAVEEGGLAWLRERVPGAHLSSVRVVRHPGTVAQEGLPRRAQRRRGRATKPTRGCLRKARLSTESLLERSSYALPPYASGPGRRRGGSARTPRRLGAGWTPTRR